MRAQAFAQHLAWRSGDGTSAGDAYLAPAEAAFRGGEPERGRAALVDAIARGDRIAPLRVQQRACALSAERTGSELHRALGAAYAAGIPAPNG